LVESRQDYGRRGLVRRVDPVCHVNASGPRVHAAPPRVNGRETRQWVPGPVQRWRVVLVVLLVVLVVLRVVQVVLLSRGEHHLEQEEGVLELLRGEQPHDGAQRDAVER